MLLADKLKQEIQKFSDTEYAGFVDFPVDVIEAKQKWGDAFQVYINDIIAIIPPTILPNNTSANVSGCGSAFIGPLIFDNVNGTQTSVAQELSDAWEAAMNAILLIPGANYLGTSGTIISITPFSTISTNKTTLYSTLLGIFANINNPSEVQITSVANAFHTATTSSITTTCVYQNPSSPPPTLGGPLGFG